METNNNIDRLLDVLDNPERYSEQEIMDTINHDEETREFYRQLVRAKQARNRQHSAEHPADVDAAWQQFEQRHLAQPERKHLWHKAAAIIIGILMMSGITWATIYTVRHIATNNTPESIENVAPTNTEADAVEPCLGMTDSIEVAEEPAVYDNVTLEEILDEVADYYGLDVQFLNNEARDLRFHFVWNKADGLDKVLEDLEHFERVDVKQKDNLLIVQ